MSVAIVGLENSQSLYHFITSSPWTYQELRAVRLNLILEGLKGEAIDIIIDKTGDPKKGNHTDYVDRQYGESSSNLISVLAKLKLQFMVSIRTNQRSGRLG